MYLVRQYRDRKACAERRAERAPPPDHLADGLIAPQAETEGPGRDSGDNAVALGPLLELETRDGGVAGGAFGEFERGSG
jgi:hypothetical protein